MEGRGGDEGAYRGEAGLEGGDDASGGLGLVANLLDEGVLFHTKNIVTFG